jgi:flagellin-like hook-associated protein FlgL
MAISDISLTAGLRTNLLALQKTSSQLQTTQDRLSSGKKVNSALDNPTNFFAAQGHMQRASDLSDRKDGMAEAIQTVKAADAGIKGITSLIQSAKGLANAALATQDPDSRSTYATQFDTIRTQIDELAADSGYRGTNLLGSATASLTVEFSAESGVSTLDITGFDATTAATGLNIAAAAASWAADTDITTAAGELDGALTTLRSQSSTLASNLSVVTTRQEFTQTMINTLQTGSDNLTLADMNEEGANMLMLQTRQSLGTTALSLSSQAAQSILRLF